MALITIAQSSHICPTWNGPVFFFFLLDFMYSYFANTKGSYVI